MLKHVNRYILGFCVGAAVVLFVGALVYSNQDQANDPDIVHAYIENYLAHSSGDSTGAYKCFKELMLEIFEETRPYEEN